MPAAAKASKMAGASRSATAGSDHDRSVGKVSRSQPREQVEREPDPGVGELRQVRVRVDHPRQQDPGPEVEGGDADVARRGRRRSDGGDPTRGVDVDERVGFVQEPAGRERGQQSRPKRERRTFRKLATRHDARLARPSRGDPTVVVGRVCPGRLPGGPLGGPLDGPRRRILPVSLRAHICPTNSRSRAK